MRKIVPTLAAGAVCLSLMSGAALAMGSKSSTGSTDSYSEAEKAVKAKQYRAAIGKLEGVVAKNPRNVDALNYLAYSHRQLGEYDKAMGYYQKALSLNPDHRGANEYLGQLYLKMGNKNGARAQLAKLRQLCGSGCEEYESLRAAIGQGS